MTRPAWPPHYLRMPIELLTYRAADGHRLPASALETWADLRALAWGRAETEALDFDDLRTMTAKGRSTLCGHLALLERVPQSGLRWKIKDGCLIVSFDDAGDAADRVQESGLVQKAGPAPDSVAAENKLSPESRTLDSSLKDLKELKPLLKTEGRVQKAGLESRKLDSDPRSRHAAIQACRKLTNRYPDKSLYDRVIAALGEQPDAKKLAQCRAEWLERGFNPNSWKWATEWYVAGIPAQGRPNGKPPAVATGLSAAEEQAAQDALRAQVRRHKEAQHAQNR